MRPYQWVPPAIFLAHAVDEYVSGFPAWATNHFGTTPSRFYRASHVVLIGAVGATAREAAKRTPRRVFQVALASIAAGFVANALFHVETRFRLGRSPGLISALTVMAPGGVWTIVRMLESGDIKREDLWLAIAAGAMLNGAAVASLRVDMPTLNRKP